MIGDYITMPTGRPTDTPATEPTSGAYYYKYSYNWAGKSVSTQVNFCDMQLKRDTSKKNNAYIFLSCIGPYTTPPEFGLTSCYDDGGIWYWYYKEANSKEVNKGGIVFNSGDIEYSNEIYTYTKNSDPKSYVVTLKITKSGTNILGTVMLNNSIIVSNFSVSGQAAGIDENANNDMLCGVSYVPVEVTTSPGGRNAFMKHVYLQDAKVYSEKNYTGTETIWEPDLANTATHYSLVYNTDYITYNRFGTSDEEISTDYNK